MKELRKATEQEVKKYHGGWFNFQTLNASVDELTEVFGKENIDKSGDRKSKHEWFVKFGDRFFCIYDWKEYRDYPNDEMINWHIGSKYSRVEDAQFTEAIEKILEKNRNSKETENVIVVNSVGQEETITIDLRDYPKAFKAKVEELLEQGSVDTKEEAEKIASEPITLELYYHKHCGLFAVETEAVECGGLVSPYNPETELISTDF